MARNQRITTLIIGCPRWYLWCLRWWPANAGAAASIATKNKSRIFFIFLLPYFILPVARPWPFGEVGAAMKYNQVPDKE